MTAWKKDFSVVTWMFPEQRRVQQLRIKPVLWIMMRWFYTPHLIPLSYVIGVRGNTTGHSSSFSRAPSDHQLGSGRYFFLAREKVSHNSLQLVPNAHTCLSRTQQVWAFRMMHRPAFLQQFLSITCSLFLLLPAVWVSLSYATFLLHSLPFS